MSDQRRPSLLTLPNLRGMSSHRVMLALLLLTIQFVFPLYHTSVTSNHEQASHTHHHDGDAPILCSEHRHSPLDHDHDPADCPACHLAAEARTALIGLRVMVIQPPVNHGYFVSTGSDSFHSVTLRRSTPPRAPPFVL